MIEKKDYVTPKPGILITHKGKFNLDEIYKEGREWFASRKYDFNEKDQVEIVKPEGNELRVRWFAERKVDDYVKFHIQTKFFMLELQKLKEGYNSKLKINVTAFLELDYRGNWGRNLIGNFLFYIYNNFIIKKKIQKVYETKIYKEFLEYTNLLKKILNITR